MPNTQTAITQTQDFWSKFITKTNVDLPDLPDLPDRYCSEYDSFLIGMAKEKAKSLFFKDKQASPEEWVTAETIDGAIFAYPNVEGTVDIGNLKNYGPVPNMDAQAFGLIVSLIVYGHVSFDSYKLSPRLSEVMGYNYNKLRTSFYELIDAALYPDAIAEDADDETTTRIAWFSELTIEQKAALDAMTRSIYSMTN